MGRRSGRVAVALVALVVAGVPPFPGTGAAHDSLAPPGRKHTWLPAWSWVHGHWIPFDEQALEDALGLDARDLEAYLYNDHHTLADLARARGLSPEQLADALVAPWRQIASDARLRLLRENTLLILTHGHLAQHVFFHVFHGVPVRSAAPGIFGVSGDEFWRQRMRGRTPLGIARRGGRSAGSVRRGMIELFRARHEEGLRLRLAWAPESDRILRRQLRGLPCWLHKTMPAEDAGNPYGKARRQHGHHPRGWPGTAVQRRRNERRVERFRRSLPRSCWRPPPAWSWRAHELHRF